MVTRSTVGLFDAVIGNGMIYLNHQSSTRTNLPSQNNSNSKYYTGSYFFFN